MAQSGEFAQLAELGVGDASTFIRSTHADVLDEVLVGIEQAFAHAPGGAQVASFSLETMYTKEHVAVLRDTPPAPFYNWAVIHTRETDDPQGNFGDQQMQLSSIAVGMRTRRVRSHDLTIYRAKDDKIWPVPRAIPRIMIAGGGVGFIGATRDLLPPGERSAEPAALESQIEPLVRMARILGSFCTSATYNEGVTRVV
jgi:hypothetical protein